MVGKDEKKVITGMNIREHFHQSVGNAIVNQGVDISDHSVVYIVNLLTNFSYSNQLYDQTPDGLRLRPLVHLYVEAATVSSQTDRNRVLKRLGDVALFIAGVFTESLTKRLAGVDYYIAMGGTAYGYLSEVLKDRERKQGYGDIFDELSSKFTDFVDILGEVSEQSSLSSNKDLLRLYDFWIQTNSKRAEQQLKKHGIYPGPASVSQRKH